MKRRLAYSLWSSSAEKAEIYARDFIISAISARRASEEFEINVFICDEYFDFLVPFFKEYRINAIPGDKDINSWSCVTKFYSFRNALDLWNSFIFLDNDTLVLKDLKSLKCSGFNFYKDKKMPKFKGYEIKFFKNYFPKLINKRSTIRRIEAHIIAVNQKKKNIKWGRLKKNMSHIIEIYKKDIEFLNFEKKYPPRSWPFYRDDEFYFSVALLNCMSDIGKLRQKRKETMGKYIVHDRYRKDCYRKIQPKIFENLSSQSDSIMRELCK